MNLEEPVEDLHLLQFKANKVENAEETEEEEEAAEEEEEAMEEEEEEEVDVEDNDEADVEDENKASAESATDSTDEEDESDVEWGSLEESMTWPTGPIKSKNKYCKRGRGTSCSSPRSWLRASLSLAKCSDKCTNDKKCKEFFYNPGTKHCGVCKRCDAKMPRAKNQQGYNVYKKWELKFPFRGLCKEKHSSQKRLRAARGCKKRAKKLRHVAFAYNKKSKQCRSWKKCSASKKGSWYVNKVR